MIKGKLVRDLLATPITEAYPEAKFKNLSGELYAEMLKKKLTEETEELLKTTNLADTVEELGDVLEVIECLMLQHEITLEEVIQVKKAKAAERGSFKTGLFWLE